MTIAVGEYIGLFTHGNWHTVTTVSTGGDGVSSASSAKGYSNLKAERVRRVIAEYLDDNWDVGAVITQHSQRRPNERVWATVNLTNFAFDTKRRTIDYVQKARGIIDVVVSVDQEKGNTQDVNELLRAADGVAEALMYEHVVIKSYGLALLGLTKLGMLTYNDLGLLEIEDYGHGIVSLYEARMTAVRMTRQEGTTPADTVTRGPSPVQSITVSFDFMAQTDE